MKWTTSGALLLYLLLVFLVFAFGNGASRYSERKAMGKIYFSLLAVGPMRPFWRIKIYFKVLRAMFVLWLLDKLTYEEKIPLVTYGRFLAQEGDIAVINDPTRIKVEIGKVVMALEQPPTIHLRIYRRPK